MNGRWRVLRAGKDDLLARILMSGVLDVLRIAEPEIVKRLDRAERCGDRVVGEEQ